MLFKKSVLKNISKFTDKHKKQSSGGVLSKEKMFLKILQNSLKNIPFNKVAGWKQPLEIFCKTNFANFTGNDLCWILFLIKLHFWGLQRYQRRLRHRCFPLKFAIILKNVCESLLVNFKPVPGSLQQNCKLGGLKVFNSIRKRL